MKISIIIFLSALLIFASPMVKQGAAADWRSAGECYELIKSSADGRDTVIRSAGLIIRQEQQNAAAHACIAMAYYLSGKKQLAMKQLQEAIDTLPKKIIDVIHDNIWNYMPEILAEKEYRDNHTLSGGACILKNVTSLNGSGYVIIGEFLNPFNNKTDRHLRGYKCEADWKNCSEVDIVCPECTLQQLEAKVIIGDYRITGLEKIASHVEISRNVRYIAKILELQRQDIK